MLRTLKKLFASLFGNGIEEAAKAEIREAVREVNEEVKQFLADPGAAVPEYNELDPLVRVVVDEIVAQLAAKAQAAGTEALASVWRKVEEIVDDVADPAPEFDFLPVA